MRRIKGVTERDRIRNVGVRAVLRMQSTLEFIEERRLNWWGNLQRMDERNLESKDCDRIAGNPGNHRIK